MLDIIVCQQNKPVRSCELTPRGLVVSGSLSFAEWRSLGSALRKCQGAVQWWIGDWLNYGEKQYGETYAQALDETDYDKGSLANLKYVAARVESSLRNENLSWDHHRMVAPLERSEQKKWLKRAEEEGWSVATLRAAIRDSKGGEEPTWLKHTDVWNFISCDGRYGIDYPGRVPGQIVLNVLHYYTHEADLVIDPMAGGGTTIDACKELRRRCFAFDIQPARDDIQQGDATQTWGVSEQAHLVFIDPPYWSQMESDYGGMASLPYREYLSDMKMVFGNARACLVPRGILAVLIAPVAIKADYTDIPVDFIAACRQLGFCLARRISVPVSSEQVGPRVMEDCRDKGILVALLRDLLIFENSGSLEQGTRGDNE